jgi:hypothetical protein
MFFLLRPKELYVDSQHYFSLLSLFWKIKEAYEIILLYVPSLSLLVYTRESQ